MFWSPGRSLNKTKHCQRHSRADEVSAAFETSNTFYWCPKLAFSTTRVTSVLRSDAEQEERKTMMGPVSDKNRKSWIHVLILCIIYMFSSCVLYSPDMSCRQCARSPPHIPCCPLMSQFMFGGRLVGDGGWWGDQLTADKPHFILISHWHSMFSS